MFLPAIIVEHGSDQKLFFRLKLWRGPWPGCCTAQWIGILVFDGCTSSSLADRQDRSVYQCDSEYCIPNFGLRALSRIKRVAYRHSGHLAEIPDVPA
jgi:hypothetical protein